MLIMQIIQIIRNNNYARVHNSNNTDANYDKLRNRINVLGNEVHEMRENFDHKILMIMKLLKDIKSKQYESSDKGTKEQAGTQYGNNKSDFIDNNYNNNILRYQENSSIDGNDGYLSISMDDTTILNDKLSTQF